MALLKRYDISLAERNETVCSFLSLHIFNNLNPQK